MAKKARIVWDVNPEDLEKSLKLLKQIRKEAGLTDDQVEQIGESFEENEKAIKKNVSGIEDLKGTIAKLGLAAIVAGAATAFVNLSKEIEKARKETAQLTSLTGRELDIMVAKVRATAKVFNKEYNEVLRTANTVSKEFGITMNEALETINQGFLRGIDINGEYLDSLREYSTFAREAGLSTKQFNIILQTQIKEGVFSDKGIDAIKEAVISLREMTPATKDAITAIGINADQVTKDIQSGAKTYFEVIQEISRKTNEITDPRKIGAIYADVFRGAGEDAGDFILKLGGIGEEYENLTDEQRVFMQQQQNLIVAQEKLNLLLVEFAADMGKAWRFITDLGLRAFSAIQIGQAGFLADMELTAKRVQATWAGQNASSILNQIIFVKDELSKLEKQSKKNTDEWLMMHTELSVLEGLLEKTSTKATADFVNSLKEVEKTTEKATESFEDLRDIINEITALSGREFADSLEDTTAGLEKLIERQDEIREMKKMKDKAARDEEFRLAEEHEIGIRALQEETFRFATETFNLLTGLKLSNLQREFQAAEGNEKKQRMIMRQMAQIEKRNATFNAIINTALGVTRALASAPPPFNFILAAQVAALGAVQIGVIQSQPLPKFRKGAIDIRGRTHEAGGIPVEIEDHESIISAKGTRAYPELLKKANNLELNKSVVDALVHGRAADVTVINSDKELIEALNNRPDWQIMVNEHGFMTRMRSKFGSYQQQRSRFTK
jgi:hypothetical protein